MKKQYLATAMNNEQADPRGSVAINFEFKDSAAVPDWIQLLPAGPVIKGRDGRHWLLDDPQALVEMFKTNGVDLPVDVEHATELKGPAGEPAPAVGWIKEIEVRDAAIWGRVEWNNDGGWMVGERQYRYLSPVFTYDRDTLQIQRLKSAALTNQPNMALQALNREGQHQHEEDVPMKKIYAALGLADNATEQDALNAIGEMKGNLATAANRADNPSLEKFVPRADYDTALNRATTAEGKLKAHQAEQLETAITAEIDAALKAGKITPGTKDYYVAQCRQSGGLDSFKKFVEAAPVIGDPSTLGDKKPENSGTALNAEETKIAAMFGNTAEDIKKYGALA